MGNVTLGSSRRNYGLPPLRTEEDVYRSHLLYAFGFILVRYPPCKRTICSGLTNMTCDFRQEQIVHYDMRGMVNISPESDSLESWHDRNYRCYAANEEGGILKKVPDTFPIKPLIEKT